MALKSTISLAIFLIFSISTQAQQFHARNGLVDLREYDFSERGHIDLSGEWKFYMRHLIPAENFGHSVIDEPGDLVSFPMTWNEINKSRKPSDGFGTFYLRLLAKQQEYAFELPHFYTSYSFWINGTLVASNGIVGTSASHSQPQWRPLTVTYTPTSDTLDIVIHVSNFYHGKGGIRENILIGSPSNLLFKRDIAIDSNLILCGGLLLISTMFAIIYFIVKRDVTCLYFCGLSLTWAIRSLFSNLYVANFYIPDFPWETGVKIEYITLYLTMIWAISFLSSLFPDDVNSLFRYLFIGCNAMFCLITIIFKATLYTQFLPVYLSFCLVLLIYIIYVLIRAFIYERQGVWLIVCCLMLGVIVFAYDLSAYEGFASFSPVIINVGYLSMFIFLAFSLASQFGILKRTSRKSDMLTYEDLYGSGRK